MVEVGTPRADNPEPARALTFVLHEPVFTTATEVAAMAENTLQYQALVRLLNRELSIALNDGRR